LSTVEHRHPEHDQAEGDRQRFQQARRRSDAQPRAPRRYALDRLAGQRERSAKGSLGLVRTHVVEQAPPAEPDDDRLAKARKARLVHGGTPVRER